MQPQNARLLPSPSRPVHPVRRRAYRVHLPRDTVLTRRVLVGVVRKLPTPELERIIDALIAKTDLRASDTDLEPDSDDEPDDTA